MIRFDRIRTFAAAAAVLAIGAIPTAASAQEGNLWAPFIGCWTVIDGAAGERVCIDAGSTTDASIWTSLFADGERISETVVADGVFRPVETEDEDCRSESAARFSDDARRIYIEGRYDCTTGDVDPTSSGMIAFVTPDTFIDVRTLEIDGQPTVWVQRYSRALGSADDASPQVSRMIASSTPSWATIVEVGDNVASPVAVAWLAEVGIREPADGRRLVALDDAGLPDSVLDVVVALSNPGVFRLGVGPQPTGDRVATAGGARGGVTGRAWSDDGFATTRRYGAYGRFYRGSPYQFWDDVFYGPDAWMYYNGSSRWGYYNSGGFGYPYWGGGGWAPYPWIVTVAGGSGGSGGTGRAINGSGYSSGRPSSGSSTGTSATPSVRQTTGSSSSTGRGAVRRDGGGRSGGGSGGGAATRSTGGGGGGSVSRPGSSSSGGGAVSRGSSSSSSSTGRTAVRRDGRTGGGGGR